MQHATETQTFDPKNDHAIFHDLIKYAIAPRPICFASTISAQGEVNLSPFSYFNIMSHEPPICVFSPLRRMRDGSTKHTLENILEVKEVVINIVNYDMVQQQSLASTEYPQGVNEFEKAGFTPLKSAYITPPRVQESPIQLECKVQQVIPLSEKPGAGNLVIAEIICMHVQKHFLRPDNSIDQAELDLVARLGGNWYCRVNSESLFAVPKPLRNLGIGIDMLPTNIRYSPFLTGNQLGILANVEHKPYPDKTFEDESLNLIRSKYIVNSLDREKEIHLYIASLIDQGDIEKAWQIIIKEQDLD